jgi:hypothetical protein
MSECSHCGGRGVRVVAAATDPNWTSDEQGHSRLNTTSHLLLAYSPGRSALSRSQLRASMIKEPFGMLAWLRLSERTLPTAVVGTAAYG